MRRSHERLNKAMSRTNKIAHFQRMRRLPRNQPHSTAGRNTGGNVRLSHRCSLESTDTFTKTNNQAPSRALAKWLKHSNKHSNKTIVKKRLVWHVMTNTFNIHLLETPEISSQERLRLWMFISIAMYPAIRSFDERHLPNQGEVEQVKSHGGFRPQRGYPGNDL